jgi:hypothetical protein
MKPLPPDMEKELNRRIGANQDSQLRSGFEISADNGKMEFTF